MIQSNYPYPLPVPNETLWAVQFSERIRTLMERKAPRMTLPKLADAAGLPYHSVYGYVIERKRVPAWVMVKLAAGLGVSVDVLAGVV